jgi:hypothetical protein
MGPKRIVLDRHSVRDEPTARDSFWWVVDAHNYQTPLKMHPSCTDDFLGVEYCLSHCVQACLAKEPVLAVCLSISHTFTPERFQSTFSSLYMETVPQRTRGAVDGELNEIAMFATLQVACKRDKYPETLSVVDMLHQLHRLLHVKRVVVPWGLDI